MPLDLQYDLANLTPADASPVEANFNRIAAYVNTEMIDRAGTVAMTGQLKLVGNPVNALEAVPKSYVDSFVPIGAIMMFGGAAAPPGGTWALANGAELQTAQYPDLFAVIGGAYGSAGAGRFNLPNLAAHFPFGAGVEAIGATGGSRDAIVPIHTHPIDHNHAQATSAAQSASHTHAGAAHTHTFADSSSTTGVQSASHKHAMRGQQMNGSGGTLGLFLIADDSLTAYPVVNSSGAQDTNHTHTVSVSGTTSGASATTTGNQSASHTHTVDLPSFAGASGAAAGGVTPVGARMPPFVVVNYIIRLI